VKKLLLIFCLLPSICLADAEHREKIIFENKRAMTISKREINVFEYQSKLDNRIICFIAVTEGYQENLHCVNRREK